MDRSFVDAIPVAVPKPKVKRSKSTFEGFVEKLEEKMEPKQMIMVPLAWRPSVYPSVRPSM